MARWHPVAAAGVPASGGIITGMRGSLEPTYFGDDPPTGLGMRCHGLLATGGIVACVGCCVCVCARARARPCVCAWACSCSRLCVRVRLRLRARVRAGPCVLAFAFACAPSVAMFPLGRAMLYSCVRARYMCLRSGRGSDVNVNNVRRGLKRALLAKHNRQEPSTEPL